MKDENGIICDWLSGGTYRIVMHRHDGTWRAVDESEGRFCNGIDKAELAHCIMNNWFEKLDK